MDDIVRATGVSRYGLYGTFGNKREPFEKALDRYADGMGKQSFLRLLEPQASLQHIRAIFDERVAYMCDMEERKGCLFIHTAMQLAPRVLAAEIQKHLPDFTIDYDIDPVRQSIAESWPDLVDDSAARAQWSWEPAFDVAATTRDMLTQLRGE